jgi:hypothetical protein
LFLEQGLWLHNKKIKVFKKELLAFPLLNPWANSTFAARRQRMAKIAEKTNPKLWGKVKTEVTDGDKGGRPGQWSARKAQMATQEYKKEGGGYKDAKSSENHLAQWTKEDWGTKSGEESGKTGERYLPEKARAHLTDAEYKRTTAKKRADTVKGKQFSAQPKDVAIKTAQDRDSRHGVTRAALLKQAAAKGIAGRSKMKKAALEKALQAHG